MNYQQIYNNIITRARNEQSNGIRKKKNGTYYEGHHPLPKCLKKEDNKDTVLLIAREHFICHMLLCEIYPDNNKLRYALWMMCNCKNKKQQRIYKISSRQYEYIRQLFVQSITGKNNPSYNKSNFERWVEKYGIDDAIQRHIKFKTKISIATKGNPKKGPCKLKNRPRTLEVKQKIFF